MAHMLRCYDGPHRWDGGGCNAGSPRSANMKRDSDVNDVFGFYKCLNEGEAESRGRLC